jgi:hypothetical protein
MDHVVERMMHGEIVQMKRERLIRITRCHVVESVMSQYCGWQSRAGVVRYLKFREPYTEEHDSDQQEALARADGSSQIIFGLPGGELGPRTQLPGGNTHAWGSCD